jgi:hypothetical protein
MSIKSSPFTPIVPAIFLIFLAFSVLVTSILNQSADQTSQNLGLASPRPTMNNAPQIDIIVPPHGNFPLPSPGMLPTHPLYPLRMVSNRLFLLATMDPQQRAQLLFTYSNLRMSAANQLIMQGEVDAAISTAIKGQAYLQQAIANSHTISSSNQTEWYSSLKQALLKHEEVIEKIRFVAQDASRDQANRLWHQLSDYRQQVSNLSGTQFNLQRPEDLPAVVPSNPTEPYL